MIQKGELSFLPRTREQRRKTGNKDEEDGREARR